MATPTLAASAAALGAAFTQFASDVQNQPPVAQQQLAAIAASLQSLQAGQHTLQQSVHTLQQSVDALRQSADASACWQQNSSIRLRNSRPVSHATQLEPLYRERPSQGAHQQGSLPPAGVFPATCADAHNLTVGALAALEDFYGEQFGPPGATVIPRRAAFLNFIGL